MGCGNVVMEAGGLCGHESKELVGLCLKRSARSWAFRYVNPVPNVTGGPDLVKLLTQDLSGVTGGLLNVEKDAGTAADQMLGHIESNSSKLGL